MDKTGVMWLALPIRCTTTIMGRRDRFSIMCLVPDKVSVVHLVRQVLRPLHVPRE